MTRKTRLEIQRILVHEDLDEGLDQAPFGGKFTDEIEDGWVIDRKRGEYVAVLSEIDESYEVPSLDAREYRFFKPEAGGEKPGTEDFRKYGLQDWERAEALERCEWCYLRVWAEARVVARFEGGNCGTMQRIRSSGTGGIPSDDDYADVVDDELGSLKAELLAFGMEENEIDAAIAAMKKKEGRP